MTIAPIARAEIRHQKKSTYERRDDILGSPSIITNTQPRSARARNLQKSNSLSLSCTLTSMRAIVQAGVQFSKYTIPCESAGLIFTFDECRNTGKYIYGLPHLSALYRGISDPPTTCCAVNTNLQNKNKKALNQHLPEFNAGSSSQHLPAHQSQLYYTGAG